MIHLTVVGKIKENYLKEGIGEFTKRLRSYSDIQITEVSDEPAPEKLSLAEMDIVKRQEGERILDKIKDSDYVIVLDLKGKTLSSEGFSKKISQWQMEGHSSLNFVIGGSLGLSDEVLRRADFSLSFGKMTYPHKLMRLILLEQIYRGFRILHNHPYHK